MREDLAANQAILKRLAEIDRTLLVHDLRYATFTRNLCPCWRRSLSRRAAVSAFTPDKE